MREVFKIQASLNTGQITITDEKGGNRTLNGLDMLEVIRDQFKYLKSIKLGNEIRGIPVTEHLRKDIATYAYILNHEDPGKTVQEYVKTKKELREKKPNVNIKNFEVAEHLGWKI